MNELEDLIKHIEYLLDHDAIHVKRGYKIREAPPKVASLHTAEEALEFHGAVVLGEGGERIAEEAGDMLACFLHALMLTDLSFADVCTAAKKKLEKVWTTDPSQVTAVGPSFSKSTRIDKQ